MASKLETVWGAEISRKNLRRKAAKEKVGISGPQKKKIRFCGVRRPQKSAQKTFKNLRTAE
jgi:hypothetical protein